MYARIDFMDLTYIYAKYKGLWVALSSDEENVIGKGKSVQEAIREAEKKGFKDVYLFKVPTQMMSYVAHVI